MRTTRDILQALTELAPIAAKMDFDNVGLLAGSSRAEVGRVLVALDITGGVISEAAAWGADLIVSHHPLFFSVKSVTDETVAGRKLLALLTNKIAAICMHTNLDAAFGGVNDALAFAIGLQNTALLGEDGRYPDGRAFSYGRVGFVEEKPLAEYLPSWKAALGADGLRYHDAGKPVRRLASVGGSGGDYLGVARELGCDTLLTADLKYDVFLEARELEMNLVDAGHFCTENTVVQPLAAFLRDRFHGLEVEISRTHTQLPRFFT